MRSATVGYAAPEGVLQPTTPRRYDEYGVLSMAWALFTGEHPYEKLWRQYEALTACEKARVEKAVTDSALDCGSVHHRLGLAVYLNAIPGIDHVRTCPSPTLSRRVQGRKTTHQSPAT